MNYIYIVLYIEKLTLTSAPTKVMHGSHFVPKHAGHTAGVGERTVEPMSHPSIHFL